MDKPLTELDRNELNLALAEKMEKKPVGNPEGILAEGEYQLSPKRAWEAEAWYYTHETIWSPRDFCNPSLCFWLISRLPQNYEIFLFRSPDDKGIWLCQIADKNKSIPIGYNHFMLETLAETSDLDPGCAIVRALLQVINQRPEIISELSLLLCSDTL